MLKRLYVDNFRCLVNFELTFQPLTLLLGANGSGKSSVFDIFSSLRALLSGAAKITDPSTFPNSTLTRWQKQRVQVIELDAEINRQRFRYRIEIDQDPQNRRARIQLESLNADSQPLFLFVNGEIQLFRDDHSHGPAFPGDWSESALARVVARNDNRRLTTFLEFMRQLQICSFYPQCFSTDSDSEDPILKRNGANFASWYRHSLQENPGASTSYLEALREAIPDLQELRLERVGRETRALLGVFDLNGTTYSLGLDELSDGQRMLLALYGLVHFTGPACDTVLLDEPDNYLSLPEIQPWLMELSDRCGTGGLQAILTSHHPEVIDYLGAREGVILEREVSGVTQVKRLSALANEQDLKLSEIIARGWER
jgi:predicted ATPase